MSSDNSFFSRWDLGVGIVGLVSVPVLSLLVVWVNGQRPTKKLDAMFALLDSADTLFATCFQDGLIKGKEAISLQNKLKLHRKDAETVSQKALCVTSLGEDFANVLRGLTNRINKICKSIRTLRAHISTISCRERERLEALRAAQQEGCAIHDTGKLHIPHVDLPLTSVANIDTDAITLVETVDYTSTTSTDLGPSDAPVVVDVPGDATVFRNATSPNNPAETTELPRSADSSASIGGDSSESPMPQQQRLRHADRRSSTSSQLTALSTHHLRWQVRGTPLSRARAIARFFGRGRDKSRALLPLHSVQGEQEIVFEASLDAEVDEKGAEDWIDEEVVGVDSV